MTPGKTPWSLLPWSVMHNVVNAFQVGAKKYGKDDWKRVVSEPGGKDTYWDAAFRHLLASKAEFLDESGVPHLAMAAANCLILLWERCTNAKPDTAAKSNPEATSGFDRGPKF